MDDPDPGQGPDPRLERARSSLARFSPSGREARLQAIRNRAMNTVLAGLIICMVGLLLILFLGDHVPINISGSMAFLGMVLIGFGIVVWVFGR